MIISNFLNTLSFRICVVIVVICLVITPSPCFCSISKTNICIFSHYRYRIILVSVCSIQQYEVSLMTFLKMIFNGG
jgi:hypothetical protein